MSRQLVLVWANGGGDSNLRYHKGTTVFKTVTAKTQHCHTARLTEHRKWHLRACLRGKNKKPPHPT